MHFQVHYFYKKMQSLHLSQKYTPLRKNDKNIQGIVIHIAHLLTSVEKRKYKFMLTILSII